MLSSSEPARWITCVSYLLHVRDYFTCISLHSRRVISNYISCAGLRNTSGAAKDMSMTMPEMVATGALVAMGIILLVLMPQG